ncbi:FAD-binding oxidoreductase [Cryobacterium glaciale]|uniref:FAD-binding oxidoreductase n=1 Tax=Cryobacterium glaciale TaxID=1259145 RepID=A0A4R8V016_9MICO|nr:FAD-binding oxidoreductase [Cryobacterium glaciale]TFB74347.1 FAD-binding oxidoreductase [Cryobacterium glaciale]
MRGRDAIIIGGGFYGLRIALHLRQKLGFRSVLVLEREPQVMQRASYVNQARVHNGYHYPRSILTAYRSRVNLPYFLTEFADAIVDNFDHYYAIASRLSRTNGRQFELFCDRIGATYEPAEPRAMNWFNPQMVESVYLVTEPAFNSVTLRSILLDRIAAVGGISVSTSDEAFHVEQAGSALSVHSSTGIHKAEVVISATYSRLNDLHRSSQVAVIPVQHELTEMALVELESPFAESGITVMDGPFFSLMPYPDRGMHTLSHVRYTPHHRWRESGTEPFSPRPSTELESLPEKSRFREMYADVLRYVPALATMRQVDSLWEVKTVLTKSDKDDSRPILFKPDHGLKNLTTIMGGKLDNVYDVLDELSSYYA